MHSIITGRRYSLEEFVRYCAFFMAALERIMCEHGTSTGVFIADISGTSLSPLSLSLSVRARARVCVCVCVSMTNRLPGVGTRTKGPGRRSVGKRPQLTTHFACTFHLSQEMCPLL